MFPAKCEVNWFIGGFENADIDLGLFLQYEYLQVIWRTYCAISNAWYFLCLLYYVLLCSLYDNEAAVVM